MSSTNTAPNRTLEIRIENVISLPNTDTPSDVGLSHPALVSISKDTDQSDTTGTKLRALKRKRNDETLTTQLKLEASVNKRPWEWHPGHNELNYDYYIGIRNKRTNTLQLIQSHGLYRPRPSLHFLKHKNNTEKTDEEANSDVPEDSNKYAEQRKRLLESFGSKKTIQQLKKYERDRITDDKLDEKTTVNLNVATKRMIENDAEKGITHNDIETTESSAPPHDSTATRVADAYPLIGLMTPMELLSLEQEAKAALEEAAVCKDNAGNLQMDNPGWHPLVWERLLNTIKDEDLNDEKKMKRMQAAMHLHYLTVLAKQGQTIRKENRMHMLEEMAVSEEVLHCIIERFTMESGGSNLVFKTPTCVDKLLNYAIVMWITTCGYVGCESIGELAAAMRVTVKRLLVNAIGIGCKVKKASNQTGPEAYRISLRAPLVFPPVRRRKGRPQKSS